jgi:hypothetical protein
MTEIKAVELSENAKELLSEILANDAMPGSPLRERIHELTARRFLLLKMAEQLLLMALGATREVKMMNSTEQKAIREFLFLCEHIDSE